ncbi:DEAD/DEAH box helicase family protein [Micrococcus luteus]|nr:DEAD/DEAH box helicase family protein [Micrococcus luteus]
MSTTSTTWDADPYVCEHLTALREASLDAYRSDPRLIEEHANQEEQISVGGYASRVVRELVQNAADAMAGSNQSSHAGHIDVVLDRDNRALYVGNRGLPFSRAGLEALTHAHLSIKRGDEIGKYGLGFKSVLAVCDHPEVFSRTVSFRFGTEQDVSRLREIAPGLQRYPMLRLAVEIDASSHAESDPVLADLMKESVTVVRLGNLRSDKTLLDEIEAFNGLFLLFVDHVASVRFLVLKDGQRQEITHRCEQVAPNRFRVTTAGGGTAEWAVASTMHQPSRAAQEAVGATVTRDRVKVSVAIPFNRSDLRVGEFWSYFPLSDRTSATGIFNAPWSLVDDRTAMLDNEFNREIEDTLLELFIQTLPEVLNASDPGEILEYLASRARESYSKADARFRAKMPHCAARTPMIPDASGQLRLPSALVPLTFRASLPADVHEGWQEAPNTGDDVPHWTCYKGRDRLPRMMDLFTAGVVDYAAASSAAELRRAESLVPQRTFPSWFREWASGASPTVALRVLREAARLASGSTDLRTALEHTSFIPTDGGLKAPDARSLVFVRGDDGYTAEGFHFVSEDVTRLPRSRDFLRVFGIVELDPATKLKSQLKRLSLSSPPAEHRAIWQSLTSDLPAPAAQALLHKHGGSLLVPTLGGTWKTADKILDIPDLRAFEEAADFLLDSDIAPPALARALGVMAGLSPSVPLASEPLREDYERDMLAALNAEVAPGERGVENVVFLPDHGPGPVSVLALLEKAGAPPAARVKWTRQLLSHPFVMEWNAVDVDSSDVERSVESPQAWALRLHGLVDSDWGPRRPFETVSPKLLEYRDLLPRCSEPPQAVASLGLPDRIEDMDLDDLIRFFDAAIFERKVFPQLAVQRDADRVLERFCLLIAERYAEADLAPAYLPARRGRLIEAAPVSEIFICSDPEQLAYLNRRERFFIQAVDSDPRDLADRLGVRDFSEVFSYEIVASGRDAPELVLDRFRGLEGRQGSPALRGKYLVPCEEIRKETSTPEGLIPESLPVYFDAGVSEILVSNDLADHEVIHHISQLFELNLTNADVREVLDRAVSDELDLLRVEARALTDDAARLERYLGKARLLEALPKGLWDGLVAQGAVDDTTSVGELCLLVHGSATLKILRDQFSSIGFKDVPTNWGRNRATKSWLESMGFGQEFAPEAAEGLETTLLVEGAVDLPDLHDFQRRVAAQVQERILHRDADGRSRKVMVDMPTGVGKTRVAVQSVLELFARRQLQGPVLWIAESQELCEQAVQTWRFVWRGLLDTEPLTVGRLWGSNAVAEPVTEFSVVVATDAKLLSIINEPHQAEAYEWLREATVVVVDEAHKSGTSPMYTKILGWLGVDGRHFERPLIGLSATPFKGGDDSTRQLAARYGNDRIAGFDSDNPFSEAMEGGYLARVNHVVLDGIDVSLDAKERRNAEQGLVDKGLLDRIGRDQGRMRMVVDHIRFDTPEDWPVLVFTPSVVSAQVLAATLQFHGIHAAAVSGDTSRSERRRVIKEFQEGKLRVLTNCDLLVQGFDAPAVRSLIIARPSFSRSAYVQMVGRGLRGVKNGGKEECRIVDVQDNFGDAGAFLDHLTYVDLWKEKTS